MDKRLVNLANRFTSKDDLRDFAIKGLNMKSHEIQKYLSDASSSTTTSANNILFDWRNKQSNFVEAYSKLKQALITTERPFLLETLKE